MLLRTLYVKLALALVLGIGVGLLYLRLSAGPLHYEGLPERVAEAIATRIGPGWKVALRDTAIELDEGSLVLRATGLDIRDPQGALVVRTPLAIVSLDTFSLLSASFQPKSIEFRDLQLRVTLNPDGSLSLAPPVEGEGAVPATAARAAGAAGAHGASSDPALPSPISAAIGSLFDLVLEPTGVVGAIDRARVTNSRLTLVDQDGQERVSFDRVDAGFERTSSSERRFDMRLDGPRGSWRLGGTVRPEGPNGKAGVITATDMPVLDLLLLSGLSSVPATTDLKLSGRAEASLVAGKLSRFEARVEAGPGTVEVNDKDVSPIRVDTASAEASWDEPRRTLALTAVTFKGGETRLQLQGELVDPPGLHDWRLTLSGRDGLLSPPSEGEQPVKLDTIDATLAARDGGVAVERLVLTGPTVKAEASGSLGAPSDQRGLSVRASGTATSVRTALRLWPESVAPPVRGYMLANLRDGVVDTINIAVNMSATELETAVGGGPVPDAAVRVEFAIRDGELVVAQGSPPFSKASVAGIVTGTSATVVKARGQVPMPDGRALALSDGSFTARDLGPGRATANIAFRLGGGADALAAMLQAPLIRNVANVDLDPAAIKGRADLQVAFPIPLNRVPSFADLPLTVSGTIGDLTVDKAFGRDRLEGGNLGVSYDKAGLTIRGEARLAGAPATIDLRQPRGGAGEATVTAVLDEAARARKGLSFGSQLTGPLPIRAVVPLGKPVKPGIRVEADLAKASIDNLLPGWTKPPGRPGKVSFTALETGTTATEIKDLVVESGTVNIRGSAGFSADGSLERADLTTFKLSPGDDLHAQVERSAGGYRVQLRGNVADARPLIRSMTAPGPPSSAARDIDLDLGVNILTGFNDEALTNTTAKVSLRGREFKQLQLNGRFRSAPVTAQVVRRERSAPVLTLQSGDSGATLRFLDIYRRMSGGELKFQMALNDGAQAGTITVESFALRDEPALRRIIAQQPQAGMPEDRTGTGQRPKVDASDVSFNRLRANFTRTASRLEFTDASISGAQIGFTLGGWLDYARDKTDISGTFVPLYGLNNVFAQVPLFGPLLGGGQNEGLFALNFRVSGNASAPTLTVNPLSAVAPGFLRKLFGAGSARDDFTGAVPTVPLGER